MPSTANRRLRAVPSRAAFACLLAFAILFGSLAGVAAAPRPGGEGLSPAAITASQYCPDAEEKAMLKLINDLRRTKGLPALTLTKTLGASAEHHSVEMATYNYFSHTLRGGVTWSQNMKNHGYTYNTYRGENIAAGNSTALNTFNQWKNSAGHLTIMLSPNFKAIGIGRAYKSTSTYKWYWTADFGGYVDAAVSC
jgi:uncharacterized protein YkwD